MTKKKSRFWALPTLNMPTKSHECVKPTPRQPRHIVHEEQKLGHPDVCYKSFAEMCKRVVTLKSLSEWNSKTNGERIVLKKVVGPCILPEIEMVIDDSLDFTVKVFGCFMPDDHSVYGPYMRSMCDITIQGLIKELDCYKLCCGVEDTEICSNLCHHVVPLAKDPLESSESQPFPQKEYWRYKNCDLLCAKDEIPNCCLAVN